MLQKFTKKYHLSLPINLVDLTVFLLNFYTLFKLEYLSILQPYVTLQPFVSARTLPTILRLPK